MHKQYLEKKTFLVVVLFVYYDFCPIEKKTSWLFASHLDVGYACRFIKASNSTKRKRKSKEILF